MSGLESVQLLQEQITSTGNRIAFSRQFCNEVMRDNTAQSNLSSESLGWMLGFSASAMFRAEESDRANVQVKIKLPDSAA